MCIVIVRRSFVNDATSDERTNAAAKRTLSASLCIWHSKLNLFLFQFFSFAFLLETIWFRAVRSRRYTYVHKNRKHTHRNSLNDFKTCLFRFHSLSRSHFRCRSTTFSIRLLCLTFGHFNVFFFSSSIIIIFDFLTSSSGDYERFVTYHSIRVHQHACILKHALFSILSVFLSLSLSTKVFICFSFGTFHVQMVDDFVVVFTHSRAHRFAWFI